MNKFTLLIAVLMLAVGVGMGYWLPSHGGSSPVGVEEEAKPLFYRNPMNPDVTSPVPAQDSMGMDYVPVYADNESSEVAGTVKIDPVVVQNMGVRTAVAKYSAISRTIRALGRVDYDEENMVRLHPKVEGWIEEIFIDKTGQNIMEDDILLSIYSPKLVSTQQEYLLALNNFSALKKSLCVEIKKGAEDLVKSSRERLQLLDVPEHQIRELEKTRKIKKSLHIHSPAAGTAIRIGSRQGQYVTPATELYRVVDLSRVWVYASVYEYELPWVKLGDEVEMTLASVPGKTFRGSIAYIYPYAEAKTRTTKVRVVFDNTEGLLRPEMFAEISIQSDVQKKMVVIPAEAVVRTGERTQVFVARGQGKFEPRIVRLGIESSGEVAVLEGVNEGEEVVTSAQFLMDSESKLREAAAKMMSNLKASGDSQNEMNEHSNREESEHSTMQQSDIMDHSMHGVKSHD
jgi:Cu(I)/Ag(I) efflux system membrane fusion protein